MSVVSIHGRDAGAFARSVLHQLLERGDVAGRDADGRTVLQLSVGDWLLEELCAFEADAAELEDADGEPEPDQEVDAPATVLDFAAEAAQPGIVHRAGPGGRPAARGGTSRRRPRRPGSCGRAAPNVERAGASAVLPDLPQGAALWDACISSTKQCKKEQVCACSAASGS